MTDKQYKEMVSLHGEREMAENIVMPAQLSEKSKKRSDRALAKILKERRAAMDSKDKMELTLLQLKFQMQDYVAANSYDKNKTFSYFLKLYIDGLSMKNAELAKEIAIKPTVLSQYINNHRNPPTAIMIRLELHSNHIISASLWYQLLEKEKIHELEMDKALRRTQKSFVASKPRWLRSVA